MSTWSEVIIACVSVILTALAGWAVEKLVAWLNSKIEGSTAAGYLATAVETVADVVKAVYQTYVESLKESAEDGTESLWDAEAQKKALTDALETIKAILPTAVEDYITQTFGDEDEWLKVQIEATIYDLKNIDTED